MTGREPEARALTAGRGLIEAVIFDLDGTLADSMALVPQAYSPARSGISAGPR